MPQEITLSRIEVLTKLLNPPHGGDWVLAVDPETLNAQIVARIKGYVSDILGHEDLFPLAMAVERPDGILEGGDWTVVETPSIREHDGLYRSYKITWLDIGKETPLKKSLDFITWLLKITKHPNHATFNMLFVSLVNKHQKVIKGVSGIS
jgi:hypothetical protein